MRQIFDEVLKQKDCTPVAWQRRRLKVIHKKGDVEYVGNYRPICTMLALYKLFSTVLYSRYFQDDQIQSEGHAGFRRTYQSMGLLTTCRMIEQRCYEWRLKKMWAATIDFIKAFDSITHNSIWDDLKTCGVEPEYINFLKRQQKPKSYWNDGQRE